MQGWLHRNPQGKGATLELEDWASPEGRKVKWVKAKLLRLKHQGIQYDVLPEVHASKKLAVNFALNYVSGKLIILLCNEDA